jgi:hypothetical protein
MLLNLCGVDVLIDDEDFERVNAIKWHPFGKGDRIYFGKTYRHNNCGIITHTSLLLHRFIIDVPANMQVDHVNGNTLDNRKVNLRICSRMQNNRNVRLRYNSTSGFKGASFSKKKQKWESRICANHRKYFLGYFDTAEKAHQAYCKASEKLHEEFRRTK